MASAKVLEQPRPTVSTMSRQDLARVFLAGLAIGISVYVLYILMDRYIFTPTLCGEFGLLERCDNKESYGATMAMLIGGFGGLFSMVKLRTYRPLLVVVLATISLWGVLEVATSFPWWASALVLTVIVASAYTAFAWLVRIRSLYLAIGISAILVLAVRFVLSA